MEEKEQNAAYRSTQARRIGFGKMDSGSPWWRVRGIVASIVYESTWPA
jgi:hypothetical protein